MRLSKLLYALLWAIALQGFSLAQEREISGSVKDASGEPLLGASVVIKGENRGTQTDFDGHYRLKVAQGQTLEFSFVGMETKNVRVGNSSRIDVVLQEEAQGLDEVVVVGYGSGRKVGTTVGQVARVDNKDIAQRPSGNVTDALQGKVPGLQIYTSSGEPSALSTIRLHGVGSLGSSSSAPLFVVDGIPVSQEAVRALNQADFESISILKDASATSIYGSRASNGVVYITTKRGKNNTKGEITLNTQYGISNIANRDAFDRMMRADELSRFWIETGIRNQAEVDNIRTKYPYDTHWDRVFYKEDVPLVQADLSFAGGNDKTRYYISGGLYNQEGAMYRSNFSRYTFRTNIETKINDWLKLGANTSLGYYDIQTNPYDRNSLNGGLAFMLPPFYSPVDKNGKRYDLIPGINRYHPEYLADKNPYSIGAFEILPTGFIEITPIKNLTFKTQAGLEFRNSLLTSNRLPSNISEPQNGRNTRRYNKNLQKTLTNTLEYKFSLNRVNNFVVLLGQETLRNDIYTFLGSGEGLVDDDLILLSHVTKNKDVKESKEVNTINSVFGRMEYDYNGKYFLDFSLRRDGSSRFSPNNKYGNFWAAGAMWKLKKEKFLENVTAVNDLSIKFSAGTSGNSDIGNYTHQALSSTGQYANNTAWQVNVAGNPDLTWEKQTKYTLGLDAQFFNRLSLGIELYRRITTDMLMDVPVPYTSGFETVKRNVGKLQNQGIGISISGDVYKNKEKNINVSPYISFSYNQEKVLDLFQGRNYWYVANIGVGYIVGEPSKFFYPIFKGINSQNGEAEWYLPYTDTEGKRDISVVNKNDGSVSDTFSVDDLTQNTGYNYQAPFNGGFGFSANYKTVSLQVDFSFSQGKYLINNNRYFSQNPTVFSGFNQDRAVFDYWKKQGDVTTFPRKDVQFTRFDSRLVEDASFIRLKNVTLGYALPEEVIKQVGFFSNVRFYVSGRNLLTWTKYTGPDPEIDDNVALGNNPNTKQYAFGVELKF